MNNQNNGIFLYERDAVGVFRNQGWRDGFVLAVDYDRQRALVEYEMPNGTTAMIDIPAFQKDYEFEPEFTQTRSVSYHGISKRWLSLIRKSGTSWIGRPQGGRNITLDEAFKENDIADVGDCGGRQ